MRIRDLTEERLDEGPVWDKVKSGVKKFLAPTQRQHPLEANSSSVKKIFAKLINGEQLSRQDLATVNSIYRQI